MTAAFSELKVHTSFGADIGNICCVALAWQPQYDASTPKTTQRGGSSDDYRKLAETV